MTERPALNYETAEVPFQTTELGWQFLTDKQLVEEPWLREFVMRFRNCFERDEAAQLWWYLPAAGREEGLEPPLGR